MLLVNLIKELVIIGASVAAYYGSCLKYHVRKVTESGVGTEEIIEAIRVG